MFLVLEEICSLIKIIKGLTLLDFVRYRYTKRLQPYVLGGGGDEKMRERGRKNTSKGKEGSKKNRK